MRNIRKFIFIAFVIILGCLFFQILRMESFVSLNTIFSDYEKSLGTHDSSISVSDHNIVNDLSGNKVDNIRFPSLDFSSANRYEPDNTNVTYHSLTQSNEFYDTDLSNIRVLDTDGNLVNIPFAPAQNIPVYYDVSKYAFGIRNMTPSYRESVLMNVIRP